MINKKLLPLSMIKGLSGKAGHADSMHIDSDGLGEVLQDAVKHGVGVCRMTSQGIERIEHKDIYLSPQEATNNE